MTVPRSKAGPNLRYVTASATARSGIRMGVRCYLEQLQHAFLFDKKHIPQLSDAKNSERPLPRRNAVYDGPLQQP